jgi:two-component system chemotaxis response regulator CheB
LEKLKVMVVDHSVVNRVMMTDIINTTEFGTVVRSASNIPIALEWLRQFPFDVIILGVSALKEIGVPYLKTIVNEYPDLEILILSDTKAGSVELTLEAVKSGAIDFIVRPEEGSTRASQFKLDLEIAFTQIRIKQVLPKTGSVIKEEKQIIQPVVKKMFKNIDLVLIASSTGGPAALEVVCQKLPIDFNAPILAVQHMPSEFTHVLATTIDRKCHLSVSEAKNGDQLKPSTMFIAPGGLHMVIEEGYGKTAVIKLLDTPYHNGLKPAADILFESVSKIYRGRNILVVVLTGMGNDGLGGVKILKETCNCYCITQSEATCVVYGMPKCVIEAGMSDEACNIEDIAYRMNQLVSNKEGYRG